LKLYTYPTSQKYDAEKKMVILEFSGGFRFNFSQFDFVVSQWEINIPTYKDNGKGIRFVSLLFFFFFFLFVQHL
jgi:hypothetical protein